MRKLVGGGGGGLRINRGGKMQTPSTVNGKKGARCFKFGFLGLWGIYYFGSVCTLCGKVCVSRLFFLAKERGIFLVFEEELKWWNGTERDGMGKGGGLVRERWVMGL